MLFTRGFRSHDFVQCNHYAVTPFKTRPAWALSFQTSRLDPRFDVPLTSLSSVDEVDTEEVQQQAPKYKVSKCPLMRDASEIGLVLRVRLNTERCCKDELADAGAEAREESIEGLFEVSTVLRQQLHLSGQKSRCPGLNLRSCQQARRRGTAERQQLPRIA